MSDTKSYHEIQVAWDDEIGKYIAWEVGTGEESGGTPAKALKNFANMIEAADE